MVRSVRAILAIWLLGVTLVVEASDPSGREKVSSPTPPPAAPKAVSAESPRRIETPIFCPAKRQPATAAASHPERMIGEALSATDRARRIVVANLTNADTLGYKRQIVSFTTVLAGSSHSEVVPQEQGLLPSSYQVSAAMAPPVMDMGPGKIRRTGRALDLAIAGEGFFCVEPADIESKATVYYTRCGRFTLDARGRMVLHGLNRDWILSPRLEIPERVSNIEITTDGRVRVTEPGESADGNPRQDRTDVGGIFLNSLPPDCEFTPCGDNVYLAKLKKHQGISAGMPGQSGWGELRQGYIEGSNVDPQQEFETLQKLQEHTRVLEQAAQLLQLTDGPLREQAKPAK
jgi:flagellar basal-body rod protein FlgG